jgi:hypothetical protein
LIARDIISDYADFRTYLKREWNLNSTINTANFLSKDFWHQQSRVLKDNNLYLIRTGKGSFAILDEKQFPKPYLDLDTKNAIEIPQEEPEGFDNLKRAFGENILENAALEQLRFNRVYEKIIEKILSSQQQYHIGIRGNSTRTFDMFFFKKDFQQPYKIKTYTGQAELDYTIWTRYWM